MNPANRVAAFSISILFIFAGSAVSSRAADEGQQLFEQKCSKCHSIKRATSKVKTEGQWRSTVLRMKGNGADLSREDIEKITAHLAQNYPKK